MSTIRPLATIAILAALGIFLAQQINKQPIASTASLSGGWDEAPAYNGQDTPGDPAAAGEAPAFGAGTESGFGMEGPAFTPPTAPQPAAPAGGDSSVTPAMPVLPPLPTLPTKDPLTASDSPAMPSISAPTNTPGGPSAVDPAAINALNLPLPEDIPEADYSGGANKPEAAAPATGQITGRVPSLGTSTENAATSQPTPPAAASTDRYGTSAYGFPAPDSATNPYQPTTNDSPGSDTSATTPIDFGQNAQANQPAASPQMSAADGGVTFASAQPAIQAALDRGELARAHLLLSQWYGDPTLAGEDRREVDQLLGQLAGTVVYSTEHLLEPPHQVQAGETLETIAEQYNVPWQLIAKINGINRSDAAQPGQILKVVRGPFNAVVDLEDSEVALMLDGRYAGRFPVDLAGVQANEGTFKIDQKVTEPVRSTVYAPATVGATASVMQRKLVAKHPGGAAPAIEITAASSSTSTRYGTQPARISVAANDLDELYDILSVGSEVTIRR